MEEVRTPNTPPHSIEAEKSILGSMLLSRPAVEQAMETLRGEDFYLARHQDIFDAIRSLYERGEAVDSVTVIDALDRAGKLAAAGGVMYITELSLFVPSAANAAHYIRIVEERSVMRQLIEASSAIASDAFSGEKSLEQILDDAERAIFNISMKKTSDTMVHIRETLMACYNRVGELMKLNGALTGVTTGFRDLDELTSGLQPSDLVIIAGRPSMGKTAFALNLAQNAAIKGKKTVCLFSLEMSREQLVQRML
ncbi:MAG: replicative DNA helicase, partial [Clostridia bacterium]|nr:replicative DNA helicase [Clostridia bacterium]